MSYRDDIKWRIARNVYMDPESTMAQRLTAIREMHKIESQYPYSPESNIYE